MRTIRQSILGTLACLIVTVGFSQDKPLPPGKRDIPTDPLGEWYEVGYMMATEAAPTFRMFKVSDEDLSLRLARVIETLGVDIQTIKVTELRLLQQGWDDAVAGGKQALTFPADQRSSLVPQPLRGFHRFSDSAGSQLTDNLAEWKKAVCLVKVDTDEGSAHGTGFFIAPGLVVTNHHVIEGYSSIAVTLEKDGTSHKAKLLADEKVPDIALLEIEWTQHGVLPLGNSDVCKDLQDVVMIGYPKFDHLTATSVKGSISATDRLYQGKFEVFQVSIPSYGGNSGGPLLDLEGRVIGVHTFSLTDPRLPQFKMAQKINFVLPFLERHAHGRFERVP